MATEKITITDQLRNNIIEERKEIEYTASDLSEESGHSKYWLANIESGKTKKIRKEDLISIYKILLDDDDEENILDYVERIINQPIAGKIKNWYELIDIEDQYEDMMDFLYLESELDDLLKDIRNRITQQFNCIFSALSLSILNLLFLPYICQHIVQVLCTQKNLILFSVIYSNLLQNSTI